MKDLIWHHSSLAVRDIDASTRFFETVFGFTEIFTARNMTEEIASITGGRAAGADLRQLRFPDSDHVLELIAFSYPEAGETDGGDWSARVARGHICFVVADLNAALAACRAAGATPLGAVTEFEEGPSAYLQEPGGSIIELEQLAGDGHDA